MINYFLNQEVPSTTNILKQFGETKKENLPQNFQVLVWNIYKGRKQDFEKEFKSLTKDCQVILLQEMILNDELLPIYKNNMHWDHAANFFKNQIPTGVGTGCISKSLSVNYKVTEDLEPFVKLPKVTIITEYAIENYSQNLLVLNIHGINFKGTQGLENQINQVLKIIENHKGPVLFAGDFNTKNDERVDTLKNMLYKVGLKSVEWENPLQGKQLDQAYVRGIKVEKAVILTNLFGSDHPALSLKLSIL